MTQINDRLAQATLLAGLTAVERQLVLRAAESWQVKAGQFLCRKGEAARGLYIVLDGLLCRGPIGSGAAETEWLGIGQQFGEHSFLCAGIEGAAVAAILDSYGMLLDRAEFLRLSARFPQLAVNLCRGWPSDAPVVEASRSGRPSLGLALGGGGARGVAHLGVLKALGEMGFTIERIVGTSVGAIVAAFYGSGFSPGETLEIFSRELAPPRILRYLPGGTGLHIASLFRLGGWRRKLRRYLGRRRLEDLAIPVSMVSTDLIRGTVAIREEGDVVEGILESLSMPGPARPVWNNGQALVDGGVLNNLPADVVRSRGAEFVLAVNVAANLSPSYASKQGRAPIMWETMGRVIAVQQQGLRVLPALAADLVLNPDVSRFAFGDFMQFHAIAAEGELAAAKSPALRKLAAADHGVRPNDPPPAITDQVSPIRAPSATANALRLSRSSAAV